MLGTPATTTPPQNNTQATHIRPAGEVAAVDDARLREGLAAVGLARAKGRGCGGRPERRAGRALGMAPAGVPSPKRIPRSSAGLEDAPGLQEWPHHDASTPA